MPQRFCYLNKNHFRIYSLLAYPGSRQCGRAAKSAVIAIDAVSVQNLLAPFCCIVGKTFYSAFPGLVVLKSSSKFQSYFYENKKFPLDSDILLSLKASRRNYSASNAFL